VRNPLPILWLGLFASASAGAVPVEVYGRLPYIEQATLSPDGSMIAFVQTTQDWRVLAIVELESSKVGLKMLQSSVEFLRKNNPPD
jgi:hypothetical protein